NWVFWCSWVFLVYTFLGYPALLWLLARLRRRSRRRAEIWPRVSVIIAGHNVAKMIRTKLENTLQLDYPREKLEIIVASDRSEDDTAEVVRSFAHRGVKLVETAERRGKHYVQMVARDASWGEILVFTDTSVLLE